MVKTKQRVRNGLLGALGQKRQLFVGLVKARREGVTMYKVGNEIGNTTVGQKRLR